MQDQKADQSKILELQILSQNLQNIQAQMQKLDSNLDEFQVLRKSLDELKKINRDTEIIIPLGQGVFTRGRITEKNNLLNLVGAEIAVEKSIDETKESVSWQINSLMKVRVELESEMAKGVEKIYIKKILQYCMSKKMFMMLLLALIVPAAYAYSAGEFLDDFRSIFTGFTVGSEVQDSSDSKSAPVDSTKNSSDVSTPQKTIPSTSQKTSIGGVSCRESWACTPWSECTNSQRTRKCTDTNQCGTSSSKPSEAEPCIVQGCQDGTPTGQCSSEKPLYCSGGNLIPNCEICGCSLNYICEESLCIENVDGEETTDPEILNLPPVIQEIEDMNVLLGEPFSVYISATDIDDDSLTYYFQNQDNF